MELYKLIIFRRSHSFNISTLHNQGIWTEILHDSLESFFKFFDQILDKTDFLKIINLYSCIFRYNKTMHELHRRQYQAKPRFQPQPHSGSKWLKPAKKRNSKWPKPAKIKGQLISKGLFGILEFFQKTNETIRS